MRASDVRRTAVNNKYESEPVKVRFSVMTVGALNSHWLMRVASSERRNVTHCDMNSGAFSRMRAICHESVILKSFEKTRKVDGKKA